MNANHFDYVPSTVERRRSVFKFNKACARSAYLGYLYPICKPVRVMPGTSLSLNLAAEIRSGALVAPLMDEMYCDVFAFFVPNRIVWEHWKQFIGAVDDVLFNSLQSYNIPSFKFGIDSSDLTFYTGQENLSWNQTIACHFGLPYPLETATTGVTLQNAPSINALPFRGFTFIWNEFFRPEQIVVPQVINKTDSGWVGMNMTCLAIAPTGLTSKFMLPDNYLAATQAKAIVGGAILPTYRAHRSLWTSCLPAPSLETLNLLANLEAPVGRFATSSVTDTTGSMATTYSLGSFSTGDFIDIPGMTLSPPNSGSVGSMVADLSQALLTVNNYRETIMLQNYYDVLNRAGSRYDEIIYNIFGVRAGNAVIDIPELIVHKRFTIYRNQVVATANSVNSDGNVEPIGSQAAYIDSIVKDNFFTRSFTEHGYCHLLYTIRPAHIRYAQGIEPEWSELDKFDLYYPQFDGMGDVALAEKTVLYDFTSPETSQGSPFGYQEYGAVWKYERDDVAGWLDPHTPNSIPGFNLVENLSVGNISLTGTYLSCVTEMVAFANCCAIVEPKLAPQFVIDWRLNGTIAHPMPVYNIPGQGALL